MSKKLDLEMSKLEKIQRLNRWIKEFKEDLANPNYVDNSKEDIKHDLNLTLEEVKVLKKELSDKLEVELNKTESLELKEWEIKIATKLGTVKIKEIKEIVEKIYKLRKNLNIFTDSSRELEQKSKNIVDLLKQLKQCNPEFYEHFSNELKLNESG